MGDDHTLGAGQFTRGPANVKHPFHLLVHATDGLYLALLVDRPGDRDILT